MLLPREKWKDIKKYEGKYQVSNLGNVRSLNYHRENKIKRLKKSNDKAGYLVVGLCKNGKIRTYKVHRLVAEAFIFNPDNLPQINHKDENKNNNSVFNLEWCTSKYNNNYGNRTDKAKEKLKGRTFSEEHKKKLSDSRKGKFKSSENPNSKKAYCIEKDKIYNSTREASEDINCCQSFISLVCSGKRENAKGYHFSYIEGDEN